MNSRLTAHYRVRAEANAIEERARGLAVEQSVEMPVGAIREPGILEEIVGEVTRIDDRGDGWFDVDVALASATIGDDAGQRTAIGHQEIVNIVRDMQVIEASQQRL